MEFEEKKALVLKMLASQRLVEILESSGGGVGEIRVHSAKLSVDQVKERTGWEKEEILKIFKELSKDKFIKHEDNNLLLILE
ncbi:MAG: hypothetical protein ACP6IP_09985 [Candidatus Njordarchaeia archaeon]